MGERFFLFLVTDDHARWRALLWSWAGGTALGSVAASSGVATSTLAVLSITSSLLIFSVFMTRYVIGTKGVPIEERLSHPRRAFMDFVYAGATAALFLALDRLLSSPQAVHAAVGEALKAMRASEPVSKTQAFATYLKAERILKQRALSGPARAQALSDFATVKAALIYSDTQQRKVAAPPTDFVRGERSGLVFSPPTPTIMFRNFRKTLFAGINFSTTTPGSGILKAERRDFIVFVDSSVEGFTQDLDNIVWVNVVFRKCRLVYSGEALTMVNVLMKDCTIEMRGDVPPPIRESLMRASGNLTITSEFPA